MLQAILVFTNEQLCLTQRYKGSLSEENLNRIIDRSKKLLPDPQKKRAKMCRQEFDKYLIYYSFYKAPEFLFVFVTEQGDNENIIQKGLSFLQEWFLELSAQIRGLRFPFTDPDHYSRKIVLIGEADVGKSTIAMLLQLAGTKVEEYWPGTNQHAHIYTTLLNGVQYKVWDYGAHARFFFQWPLYLQGSDLVLLVVDSTQRELCMRHTSFIHKIEKAVPGVLWGVIATKQDLPGAMPPSEIHTIFMGEAMHGKNVPVCPLIATDPASKDKLIEFINGIFKSLCLDLTGKVEL